ncbi:MAG: type II toxin-antitoxin system VapC family toxin [Kiritimatiellae bacterium]|jgi:predicted nucleic acid-binding protein|nr:type II toxin-antitoxin system VapC family toxin [Kiritimatiellia bacterium]
MKFWDSSALVPLLIEEAESKRMETLLAEDPSLVVWYGTSAEIESALMRRLREGSLSDEDERLARRKFQMLEASWSEVQPTEPVRNRALRLLRVHPLRAANAFQLASALVACGENTRNFVFLTSDVRLRDAAHKEGFDVFAERKPGLS